MRADPKPLFSLGFVAAAAVSLVVSAAHGQSAQNAADYYPGLDSGTDSARLAPVPRQVASDPSGETAVGSSQPLRVSSIAQASSPSSSKWGAHLDLEGKIGNQRNLGEGDLFVPLLQGGTSMLFANVKARLDDSASSEGNFGLGVRHMLEAGWNLGAYGYFDRRRTEHANYFNQVTLGAEALSLDWDFRANAYLPEGRRSHNVDSLSTATLEGTTVVFRGGEERSLTGFDGEVGWRVPLFEGNDSKQWRVFGGAYRFYGDNVNPVQGPRARTEFTFDEVPGLWQGSRMTLGGEFQDDVRGKTGFVTARLRVPLQVFGEGRLVASLTPLERRMTDPIVRDIDVVSRAGAFTSEPAVVSANGQTVGTVTQLSSATTTGAALPGAITGAGSNSLVILSGSFSTTTNAVTLQSGQTLMSGGSTLTVRSAGGRTATFTAPGSSGTIAGTVSAGNAATIEMATNSVVTGLTVTNTLAAGTLNAVYVGAVSGATISNNTITATRSAAGANPVVAINLGGVSSNTTISGNTLTATATGGAGSETQGIRALAASTNVTVSGNTFNSSGSALATNDKTITADAGAVSFVTAASTGNVVVNGNHNCSAATGTVSFTNGTTCP
jgi:hypothetical protein